MENSPWYLMQDAFSLKGLTAILIFFGLGLSILHQSYSSANLISAGGKYLLFGLTGLCSVLITIFLGYVCIKWFHIHHISWLSTNLNTLIPLGFSFYALSNLMDLIYNLPNSVQAAIVDYYLPKNIFIFENWLFNLLLLLIFGFSLLRLSSIALNKQEASMKNLYKLTIVCLTSYSIKGVLGFIQGIYSVILSTGQFVFYASGLLRLVYMLGVLLESVTLILLSVDVYRKKDLSEWSVIAAFHFVAMGWLLQKSAWIGLNSQYFSILSLYQPLNYVVIPIIREGGVLITSLLTIMVSKSLIDGERLRDRNFNLSLVAIFIFSISGLLVDALTVLSTISSLIPYPWIFLSSGSSLPMELIRLSSYIPVLSIGLLLRRQPPHI